MIGMAYLQARNVPPRLTSTIRRNSAQLGVDERLNQDDPGDVRKRVDSAVLLVDRGEQLADLSFVGNVTAAKLPSIGRLGSLDVEPDRRVALASELLRGCPADAPGRARDNRHLARPVIAHEPLFSMPMISLAWSLVATGLPTEAAIDDTCSTSSAVVAGLPAKSNG